MLPWLICLDILFLQLQDFYARFFSIVLERSRYGLLQPIGVGAG